MTLCLLVLAAAVGALLAAPVTRDPRLADDELGVGDGVARVEEVLAAAAPMGAMPGMGTDPDPVAAGHRRVSVEVTVRAPEDGTLTLEPDDFALAVPDAGSVAPHRSALPPAELPPGARLSGVLVFEVPEHAGSGALAYADGAALDLVLPVPDGPHDGGTATSTASPGPHASGAPHPFAPTPGHGAGAPARDGR